MEFFHTLSEWIKYLFNKVSDPFRPNRCGTLGHDLVTQSIDMQTNITFCNRRKCNYCTFEKRNWSSR